MNDTEKLALIAEIYDVALHRTQTFNGAVGGDVAYLAGAIAKGQKVEFSTNKKLWGVLKDHFSKTNRFHLLNQYITLTMKE